MEEGQGLKNQYFGIFQIAAVYMGTVVGAGFATGKEIYQFFTRFGFFGLLGILIAGYIFIMMGKKMMVIAIRHNLKNYMEFNEWLFGKRLALFVNCIFMIMLLGVTAVMMSGAGGLFQEQLGLSKLGGMLLTIFLTVVVMSWGIQGLLSVNTFVVPAMVSFNVILAIIALFSVDRFDIYFHIPEMEGAWKSMLSPFSYTAFNLALTQAVLVPLAAESGDEEMIRKGANWGGVFLTIILISGHLSLSSIPGVENINIPTAFVMKELAPYMYGLYLFIIYGEIFSSLIGNAFGLERQLKKATELPSWFLYVVIMGVCLIVGQIEYGPLLSFLYPLFGYISLSFLILLWFRKVS